MNLFLWTAAQTAQDVASEAAKQTSTASADGFDKLQLLIQQLIDWGVSAGGRIIGAILIFIIGRILISFIKKLVARVLESRKIDMGVQTFVKSMTNLLLTILLAVAVVGKLGVDTTSFAALIASAGVAIGMALSGNLSNFAGGLIVLLLRPYKVGDWIESQGVSGSVRAIQIFHTILVTADNKVIYIPNGALSSGTVINYSREETRRVDWTIGVEYGENMEKVEEVVMKILSADNRILTNPAPFVALGALDASSVNITIRVWVKNSDYWGVFFDTQKKIYATFNEKGIGFPFPQLTIHQA